MQWANDKRNFAKQTFDPDQRHCGMTLKKIFVSRNTATDILPGPNTVLVVAY